MTIEVVILAAGKGSRMRSDQPKVLQPLAGKALLNHQLDTLQGVEGLERIILVVGHGREQIEAMLHKRIEETIPIELVSQLEQQGTGHAASQAMPLFAGDTTVLILAGDIPRISLETINNLCQNAQQEGISLLEAELEQPFGYGRLLRREDGRIEAIVEEKDASDFQRTIRSVYCGVLAARAGLLMDWLQRISCDNAQSEYYLTDVIAEAVADGYAPKAVMSRHVFDYFGINSRNQLAELERQWQAQQAQNLMAAGVSIIDPARFDLRGELIHGCDVEIDVNALLVGTVTLGDGARIGANVCIENCEIGAGTVIAPFSHLQNARIGRNCAIGPYARIRPESVIEDGARIGNFVEVKKSHLHQGVKVNHLSYVGDAEIGENSNIGAGTITCNYDGTNKHKTNIGARVFVGSNSSLIAPISIGENATVAAGSVITSAVDANALAVSRNRQKQVVDWNKKKDFRK